MNRFRIFLPHSMPMFQRPEVSAIIRPGQSVALLLSPSPAVQLASVLQAVSAELLALGATSYLVPLAGVAASAIAQSGLPVKNLQALDRQITFSRSPRSGRMMCVMAATSTVCARRSAAALIGRPLMATHPRLPMCFRQRLLQRLIGCRSGLHWHWSKRLPSPAHRGAHPRCRYFSP